MSAFAKKGGFNHLFATAHKRQFCYESLNVADGSQVRSDGGASIAASTKFLAYPDRSGGGSCVAVLPLTSYGRRHVPTTATTYQQPLYKLHTSPVHCVAFSPHDQEHTLLASGSSSGDVHVYTIPEEGLIEDCTQSSSNTHLMVDTASAVYGLAWHPSASHIVAVHHPKSVEVLDVKCGVSIWSTDVHLQDVHSCTWGWDGTTAVTTSKDKIVRLFDARTGVVSASAVSHGSFRPSIATWSGRESYFFTTGVGSDRSREIKVWDVRAMKSGALATHRIDSGSSVLVPKVDTDTGLLYVTSRGDTGFRILELTSKQTIKELTNCRMSGDPVLDFCLLPKQSLDVKGCEMARLLRLTQGSIDPVRVELPRKDKSKIDQDIYVDTLSRVATMTSEEFIAMKEGKSILKPSLVSVVDAVALVGGGRSKKMTESAAAKDGGGSGGGGGGGGTTSAAGESKSSGVEEKGVTTKEEDVAAARRRKKAAAAFGGQSKFKYLRMECPGERNVNKTWFNLKIDTSAADSMVVAATEEHFAVPWQSGGGGPIYVGDLSTPGKVVLGNKVPLLAGHKERVNVLSFNPHDPLILASGSEDADVRLWRLESGGVSGDCVNTLGGHLRAVRTVLWNPSSNNVMASASSDDTVKLWDASNDGAASVTIDVGECPLSMCYNYNGDQLAIAGRKTVLFVDARKGSTPSNKLENTHEGAKGQRVVWLRDPNYVFTVGATKQAAREFKVWDVRSTTKAVCTVAIDRGASMLNPFYDEDTNVMYLASKGESSVHIYDMSGVSLTVKPRECSKAAVPGAPMCGMCILPKKSCNVRATEVLRGLHATANSIQSISFKVPRAQKLEKYFHDDLYPPTRDLSSVKMEANEYFGDGSMHDVQTLSLCPDGMELLSNKPVEKISSSRPKASTYLAAQRKEEEAKKAKDEQFKRLEALAHQHAKYNANKSMGSRKIKGERDRVAERDADDDDSSDDSGWSDDDE